MKMVPGQGPVFTSPLVAPDEISTKVNKDANIEAELAYVAEAITLTRKELAVR